MSHIALKIVTGGKSLVAILMLAFAWLSFEASSALAQVTTAITPTTGIGSLGTTITADGNTVQITGGTRPGDGTNLFHSFDQFSVGALDTAKFLNTTPSLETSNILGRVTGGNPSSIFGTIDTMSYPGASLFLMNPAGFLFGPNATVHVGGIVAFTSADYLRLTDNTQFNTIPDAVADPMLTASPVAAFGFLGSTPGAITVRGSQFIMTEGSGISLVGGNITIESGTRDNRVVQPALLSAPSGQIKFASASSPGEFLAGSLDQAPNINDQSFEALGTIQISQQSGIRTSGESGGTILFRGGRLTVNDSTISARTGDISLDATSIEIMNAAQITTGTETAADAGHINLKASGNIEMDSEAGVYSGSEGSSGDAGNITFSSSQGDVSFINLTSVISETINSSGDSGSIKIDAPQGNVLLADSSTVFNAARGTGTLGGIQIRAHDLDLRGGSAIGGDNFTAQIARNVMIALDGRLTLAGDSFINTGAYGQAASADLIISTPDILITGKGSFLFTGTESSGEGGRLRLFTDNLQLEDGGTLSSKSFISSAGSGGVINVHGLKSPGSSVTIDGPGSGIFTNTEGTGAGGAINLSARSLTIQNGGIVSASTSGTVPRATGGSITVNATDHVTMTSGASITASSSDPGNANAGDISINAGQSLEMHDSSIKTESEKASGGNIDIQAVDRVRLVNSPISTSVPNGKGDGGNITIDPNVIVLQNSDITARAVQGAGGNITLTTPLFLRDVSSQVDAESQFGVNGTVTIQNPTSNLSETLGTLPSEAGQAQTLLTQRCAALASGQASSFVVAGREQLPADPGGWLTSPLAFAELGESLDAGHAVASTPANMAIATQGAGTVSLRRLTPAGFLMAHFAESEATGCHS